VEETNANGGIPRDGGLCKGVDPGFQRRVRHGRYILAPDSALPILPAVTERLASISDLAGEAEERLSAKLERQGDSIRHKAYLSESTIDFLRAAVGDSEMEAILKELRIEPGADGISG
jgi:hypothetical protein